MKTNTKAMNNFFVMFSWCLCAMSAMVFLFSFEGCGSRINNIEPQPLMFWSRFVIGGILASFFASTAMYFATREESR